MLKKAHHICLWFVPGLYTRCCNVWEPIRRRRFHDSRRPRSHQQSRKAIEKKICNRIAGKNCVHLLINAACFVIHNKGLVVYSISNVTDCFIILGERAFNFTRFRETKISGKSSSKGYTFYDSKRRTSTSYAKENAIPY